LGLKEDEMRVLITGAGGHLGFPVCKAFLRDGANVRVFLHRKKIKGLGASPDIVWGDITDPGSVRRAIEGMDAVVHMAGVVQPLAEENPDLATKVNVGGTRAVVDAIKERGDRIPFVFTSSAAVFGPRPDAVECLHPERDPCNPSTAYARTKVQAEELIKGSGIDYVILRLALIPYPKISLSEFKTYTFSIPLKNRIEFCHPDDMALAILNAVKNFYMVKGKTLMIGGGPRGQMLYGDMLSAVLGIFGIPLPPRHKFSEEPFPLHWYDTSESHVLLNYQNRTIDDYCGDMARKFPAPLIALMRRVIGPAFGRLIVRMM
jgi:nucleoside-diphosphate-sugar epimerase